MFKLQFNKGAERRRQWEKWIGERSLPGKNDNKKKQRITVLRNIKTIRKKNKVKLNYLTE